MTHLPIFLDISDSWSLVVGGGSVAARKVEALLSGGGKVRVISKSFCTEFEVFANKERVSLIQKNFNVSDLKNTQLVISATGRDTVDRKVFKAATRSGIPVNVVDKIELCTFIMPAVVDRNPVKIAISSSGAAPILSRALRARLETFIPSGVAQIASLATKWRKRVKETFPGLSDRRKFWEGIVDGPIGNLALAGRLREAETLLNENLTKINLKSNKISLGEVYLVGAGPGDPDLLTFRALRLMQQADVVLHDRLVSSKILNLVRRDAKRIFVGKKAGEHTLPQKDISKLLSELAKKGQRVLRLKGGDPFMFGRGGEEIEELSRRGIPFQVVPGVTSANGCATYAGIPLTHRDHAQACVFVTGHTKDGVLDLNWPVLVQPHQTVCIYMGLNALDQLMREFVNHGADAKTPAAIVASGTLENQRVIIGTLNNLAKKSKSSGIESPAMIIVGSVVNLSKKLQWFNAKTQLPTSSPMTINAMQISKIK